MIDVMTFKYGVDFSMSFVEISVGVIKFASE